MLSRQTILLFLWLISDLLLFGAAYTLAYFLRVGWIFSTDFPFDRFLTIVIGIAPLWLLTLATTRAFALMRRQWTLRNGATIAYGSLIGVALFTLGYYFRYEAFFSRLLLVYAFCTSLIVIWSWHVAFDALRRRILRHDPPAFPTLIIGVTREARRLIETLNRRRSPLKPVAILDSHGVNETEINGARVCGKLNRLEETLRKFRITHLIQCSDLEQSLNLLSACRAHGVVYILLPSVLGIVERDETVESLEGYPANVVRPGRARWWHWFFR